MKIHTLLIIFPSFRILFLLPFLFHFFPCTISGQTIYTPDLIQGVKQQTNLNKNVNSGQYRFVAWTEPLVIRKDYDLFNLLLNSKIKNAVSLTWKYYPSTIERDGVFLDSITLYDDGSHGDNKAGDGLFTLDRLSLQNVGINQNSFDFNGIAAIWDMKPYDAEIKVKYADGHKETVTQDQVLDYLPLTILILNPNAFESVPIIRQVTDSIYATDYATTIVVPSKKDQIEYGKGWPDFTEVSKLFYKYFNDDYDFLSFNCKPLCQTQISLTQNVSWGGLIKNDIHGIDQPIVDYSSLWGSNRLQYFIPINNGYLNIGTITHEILHRWVSTISATLGMDFEYFKGGSHWGYIQRNSTGFGWLGAYNGVFRSIYKENNFTYCGDYSYGSRNDGLFNDLELYLMGFKNIDSVEFPILTYPKGVMINGNDNCYKSDSLRKISKEEFLSILGVRQPTSTPVKTQFRYSDILLTTRKPNESEIIYFDQLMKRYGMPQNPQYSVLSFEEAMGGLASMETKLTPKFTNEPNALPVAKKPISRKILSINTPSMDINMDSIFIDPDGDILKFKTFTSDSIISSVNISGNILSLHPINYGSLTCVISADDGNGGTAEIAFVIEVSNTTPTASAGPDQSVNEGASVSLDGSLSTDLDGNPLKYKWTAPTGITLSSSTVAKPTFTAPEVTKDSIFPFSLIVNDGIENSVPVEVKITVLNVIKVGNSEIPTQVFKVYPNPTTGSITLVFSRNSGRITEVSVLNLIGAEVFRKEQAASTKIQIDLSNQVSGIYLLKVIIDNQQYISKIVIRKE